MGTLFDLMDDNEQLVRWNTTDELLDAVREIVAETS
jgi:hypothetical protein